MNWTEEQKRVIDLRNRNLLVSAAAGSGKTAVLVERIISMITDKKKPLDIDQLLVVTFTKAAAAEMKERIERALEQRKDENPEDDNLERQIALLSNAQITTIHSFCLHIIRNHFNEIDLDPSFRVADDIELSLLKADTISELLEDKYEEGSPAFLSFVESYARGKTDRSIEDLMMQLYNYSRSYPWPGEWLDGCMDCLNPESLEALESSELMVFLKNYIHNIIRDLLKQTNSALNICAQPDGPLFYQSALLSDSEWLEKVLLADNFKDMKDLFDLLSWEALSRKKMPFASDENKEAVKGIRKSVKDMVSELKKEFFFADTEHMLRDIRMTAEPMRVLVELVKEFSRRFQCLKEDKNVVDFSDLEHFALDILIKTDENGKRTKSNAAVEMRGQFAEILCDEYQDSNLVQETILNAVSREDEGNPNIFMVGDVKQSIYKFRLARPELFMEKYNKYSLTDGKYQRIDLHKNFRSRACVVDFVNLIFEHIMGEALGGIIYDESAALYQGADFPVPEWENNAFSPEADRSETDRSEADHSEADHSEADHSESDYSEADDSEADCSEIDEPGSSNHEIVQGVISDETEVILIDLKSEEALTEEDDEEASVTNRELEARAVALRIQQMIDEHYQVFDRESGGYRTIKYKDIVILLRTMQGWSDVFAEVLTKAGIPAYSEISSGFFDTLEIRTAVCMLSIIDNPIQDIDLAAVLKSCIGGFTDEELAIVRSVLKKGTLYDACMNFLKPESNMILDRFFRKEQYVDIRMRLKAFFDMLETFRSQAAYMSIHQLILSVFEKTHYDELISAMPFGQRRHANLELFIEKAVDYERTSYKGLFNFVRYIKKLRTQNSDIGEASVLGEGEDTVRIVSIHKSKGLEYPVVFVSGLNKRFNKQDVKGSVLIHSDYGLGPEAVNEETRVMSPTILKKAMASKIILENLGEELRVLYVALTRAKERLILTGTVKNFEQSKKKWIQAANTREQVLSLKEMTTASGYLDWIMPVLYHQEYCRASHAKADIKVFPAIVYLTQQMTGIAANSIRRAALETDIRIYEESYERERLDKRFCWVYPAAAAVDLPAKLTISEIKKMNREDIEDSAFLIDEEVEADDVGYEDGTEADRGDTIEQRMQAAARRGSAVHKILEWADFSEIKKPEDVRSLIKQYAQKGIIDPCVADEINPWKICRMVRSALGQRMAGAQKNGRLFREKQFIMAVDAGEVFGQMQLQEANEVILTQGIIDAYFEEDDGLVLIDYKTDAVYRGQENVLINRYRVQLEYYQKALERMLHRPVKEKYIYSFSLEKEIEIV